MFSAKPKGGFAELPGGMSSSQQLPWECESCVVPLNLLSGTNKLPKSSL